MPTKNPDMAGNRPKSIAPSIDESISFLGGGLKPYKIGDKVELTSTALQNKFGELQGTIHTILPTDPLPIGVNWEPSRWDKQGNPLTFWVKPDEIDPIEETKHQNLIPGLTLTLGGLFFLILITQLRLLEAIIYLVTCVLLLYTYQKNDDTTHEKEGDEENTTGTY